MDLFIVLDKEGFPTYLRDQMETAGAATQFALSHRVNEDMCYGILSQIEGNLYASIDMDAYRRIETGFNTAAQFMQALEKKALKLNFINSTDARNLEAIENLSAKMLTMMKERMQEMDAKIHGPGKPSVVLQAGDDGTYERIKASYMPLIEFAGKSIGEHIRHERDRAITAKKDFSAKSAPPRPRLG